MAKEEIQVIKPHLMNDVCRAMENLRVQSKASDWGVAICKTCHREFNYVMRDREPVPLSCVRCAP